MTRNAGKIGKLNKISKRAFWDRTALFQLAESHKFLFRCLRACIEMLLPCVCWDIVECRVRMYRFLVDVARLLSDVG